MNRKIISLVVFISLFCLTSFVLAQVEIPNPLGEGTDFPTLLTNIATGVGTLIGYIGVIMIIVAGILYLTSAGSPERIGTAKKALVYAVIGIVIGIAANAIVEVIKNVLGVGT